MPLSPVRLPKLGRHNPRVSGLRRLARGDDPALTVIDGPKLVLELVGRGVEPVELYATPQRAPELLAHPAIRALAERGVMFELDQASADRLGPTRSSQGVLAVVPVPHGEVAVSGTVIYLDRVQDPGNVGAVVRSAAAFGANGVVCSPGCGNPFSPKAVRGSAGFTLLLPVQADTPLPALAAGFAAAGGEVAATVGAGGVMASAWRPRRPLLLVLGNEGQGVDDALLAFATSRVTVPMTAGVESLNVAVTAGILLAALQGVVPSPILE